MSGTTCFAIVLLDLLVLLHCCGDASIESRAHMFIAYMFRLVLGPNGVFILALQVQKGTPRC